jgi:hypothetical protein
MEELYKHINGFPGYMISNMGNILSMKRKRHIIMSKVLIIMGTIGLGLELVTTLLH